MTATCPFCEKPFVPKQSSQRFCSITCKGQFWDGCRILGFELFKIGVVCAGVIRMRAKETAKWDQ